MATYLASDVGMRVDDTVRTVDDLIGELMRRVGLLEQELDSKTKNMNEMIETLTKNIEKEKDKVESMNNTIKLMTKDMGRERSRTPIPELKSFQKLEKYERPGSQNFRQWKIKIVNIVSSSIPEFRAVLEQVEKQDDSMDEDLLEIKTFDRETISAEFYLALTLVLGETPLTIVENVDNKSGFEAWRKLCNEFDSKTQQNLQALTGYVMQPPRVKSIDHITQAIELWEVRLREYVARIGGIPLHDSLKVCALRAIVPEKWDEDILKLSIHNKSYKELKDYIYEQVRAKTSQPFQQLNSNEDSGHNEDSDSYNIPCFNFNSDGDLTLDYMGKGKGKGKDWYPQQYNGNYKGGWPKGQGKGFDSQGKGGKAPEGSFGKGDGKGKGGNLGTLGARALQHSFKAIVVTAGSGDT